MALAALALPGASYSHAQSPPNFIVVFIDDLGYSDLSCFGGDAVETPHIDRLAAEGVRFRQFYVNSPICSPSRVALTTGQYPPRWRITSYLARRELNDRRGLAQWLDPSAPSLARIFQSAGYATGHFGKWHLGGQRDVADAPLISEYGFDDSLTNFEGLGPRVLPLLDNYDGRPPKKHSLGSDRLGRGPIAFRQRDRVTESFVAAAIEFIRRASADQRPFYVNLWPDDVHSPFHPPPDRRGDGSKRARYLGVLKTLDEQLGVLFSTIRDDPALRENTLILLCSDNGPEPGAGTSAPLRGSKAMLYEGGIRSPLIVWAPGLLDDSVAGAINRVSVFSAIDLPPTLLSIARVDIPAGIAFDGERLDDVLLARADRSRSAPLFFRRPPDRDAYSGVDDLPDLAVRYGRSKLLCEFDGSQPQLYDLDSDPTESNNLATRQPDVTARLTEALLEWHESMPADAGATFQAD